MKIAILGSGISSLAVAYFLKDKFKTTIFEKENYVGGMASSFVYDGKWITNTYHHILDGDDTLISLMAELGLADKLRYKKVKMGFLYQNKIWPFGSMGEILRFPLSLSDKFKLAKFMLFTPKDYEDKNAEEWLVEKVGKKNYEVIFRRLVENKFQKSPKEISASWFVTRFFKESKSARKEFGYLNGGLKQFIDELAVQGKARILLNTEVRSVRKIGKKYQINYMTGNKANTQQFDIIINTIAPTEFNKISELKIPEVDYLSCVCTTFVTKTPISNCYWINILDEQPFSVIFVHNNLYDGFNKNVFYILKYFPKGEPIPNFSLDDIKKVIPDFNAEFTKTYYVPYAEAIYYPDFKNMEDKIDGIYFLGIYKFFPMIRNMNSCISEAKRISEVIKR